MAAIQLDPDAGNDAGRVAGLIPTGWYPNSVSLSRDGSATLYRQWQESRRANPTGCELHAFTRRLPCEKCIYFSAHSSGLSDVAGAIGKGSGGLTQQVAQNDHFRAVGAKDQEMVQFLRARIHHVIYIIKENRSYDQVLGDLERGNGDPRSLRCPSRSRRIITNWPAASSRSTIFTPAAK